MNEALERYCTEGIPKRITAKLAEGKFRKTVSSKENCLVCENCFEPVAFVFKPENKDSYFRHSVKDEKTIECENRTINKSYCYNQKYDKKGLPIFLLKKGRYYSLVIIFYNFDKFLFDEKDEIRITDSKNKVQNFKLKRRSLGYHYDYCIDNFLSSKYTLKFNTQKLNSELKKKWGSEIVGLDFEKGAIFKFGENASRLLRNGDKIEIEGKYILITCNPLQIRQSYLYKLIYTKSLGDYCNNNKIYEIIQFDLQKTNASDFKSLANFFYDNFRLLLQKKEFNILPMWPPIVRTLNELQLPNYSNEVFIKTNNGNEISIENETGYNEPSKQFQHSNDSKVYQYKHENLIILSDQSNYYYLTKFQSTIKTFDRKVDVFIDKQKIDNTELRFSKEIKNNKLSIRANAKGYIKVYISNNYIKEIKEIIDERTLINIDQIELDDIIFFESKFGLERMKLLSFFIETDEVTENKISISDLELSYSLNKQLNDFIPVPAWLKFYLLRLTDYPISYKIVRKYFENNFIPKSVLQILVEKIK